VSSHGTEASPTTEADAEDDPLKQPADREAPADAARIRKVVARAGAQTLPPLRLLDGGNPEALRRLPAGRRPAT
jgi:hypothetical protein